MVEIYATDEMKDWYQSLTVDQVSAVDRVVRVLAQMGVSLGGPPALERDQKQPDGPA